MYKVRINNDLKEVVDQNGDVVLNAQVLNIGNFPIIENPTYNGTTKHISGFPKATIKIGAQIIDNVPVIL